MISNKRDDKEATDQRHNVIPLIHPQAIASLEAIKWRLLIAWPRYRTRDLSVPDRPEAFTSHCNLLIASTANEIILWTRRLHSHRVFSFREETVLLRLLIPGSRGIDMQSSGQEHNWSLSTMNKPRWARTNLIIEIEAHPCRGKRSGTSRGPPMDPRPLKSARVLNHQYAWRPSRKPTWKLVQRRHAPWAYALDATEPCILFASRDKQRDDDARCKRVYYPVWYEHSCQKVGMEISNRVLNRDTVYQTVRIRLASMSGDALTTEQHLQRFVVQTW